MFRVSSCFCSKKQHNLRFISTAQNKYKSSTNVDYETYFKTYPSEINITRTQFLRDKLHQDYIEPLRIGKQNYFEIGFGSGATVEQFSPYFDNLILLEPNPKYVSELDAKLKQSDNINQYRFIEDLLDDNWSPDKIFNAQELNHGMDLIIAAQCLWYLPPNSWHDILCKLYDLLSNQGVLAITLTADESVSGSIYRTIEPKFQMSNHIVDYFKSHRDYADGKLALDVHKEDYVSEGIEPKVIEQLLFYAKTLVAPYSGHRYESDEEFNKLYWNVVSDKFREANFYINDHEAANEKIVRYRSIQSHIIVQKES